jgi:hypothetical protein
MEKVSKEQVAGSKKEEGEGRRKKGISLILLWLNEIDLI